MIGKKALHGHKGFVFALGAAFLMVASFAWACTPATTVHLSANSGPAGTLVNITGKTAFPDKPVEIRWNSTDGALLGTVQGASFAAALTVPAEASPGVYYLVADGRARDTFEVTGRATSTKAPKVLSNDLWSGFAASSRPALADSSLAQGGAKANPNSLPVGLGLAGIGLGGLLFASLAVMKKRSRSLSAETNQ